MKQIFLLLACCSFFAVFSANAQSCLKGAAEKAAEMDASIVKKVSATGEVTYLRKSVCPTTGKVTYANVEYCNKSKRFVAVAAYNRPSCSKPLYTHAVNTTNEMVVNNGSSLHCTAAFKAACLQANQKMQTAKAAFASLENRVVKP